jgi:hypothetical protein
VTGSPPSRAGNFFWAIVKWITFACRGLGNNAFYRAA